MRFIWSFLLSISMLAGCGGGGNSTNELSPTYTLSGTISGLSSSGLTISNGNETLPIANGATTFVLQTPLAQGSAYSVVIKTQPSTQSCAVSNGAGTMGSSPVNNIKITCVSDAYFIGGVVTNYTSNGLVLANGSDRLTVTSSGSFTMPQAVASKGSFNLYVATQPSDQTCTVTSGAGTAISSTISNIQVNCVTAPRQYVYIANSGSDNISAYALNANTGFLTPVSGAPFSTGSTPQSLASTPSKKFLYAANAKSNSISGYAISAETGQLTSVAGSPFTAGKAPSALTVDRTGRYLLALNSDENTMSIYALDASGGALSQISGSPFKTGNKPTNLQMDGTGSFVYVVNSGDKTISGFNFDKTSGSITSIADVPYPISSIDNISLQYANQILRVSEGIYFSINASSGSLTSFTPSAPLCFWRTQVLNGGTTGFDTTDKFILSINQTKNSIYVLSLYGGSFCGATYSATPESPFATGSNPVSALAISP